MAQKIYVQQKDIITPGETAVVLIKQGTYVDTPNLTYSTIAQEVVTQHSTISAIVKKHTITMQLASPSARTCSERNKFAAQLDDFATFTWANVNMFQEFGAFIINEKKGNLKLYNGPTFKNNYSKPQFQDGYTNLTGVSFDTQTISFTIGVYWISMEDYRVLMNLLHPYEINMLSFSFEKTYGYYCKLQAIKDSTRSVVGCEYNTTPETSNNHLKVSNLPTGNKTGYRYYTELNLTFEVIGAQCAKELTQHNYLALNSDFNVTHTETTSTDEPVIYKYDLIWNKDKIVGKTVQDIDDFISDLAYPFLLTFPRILLVSGKTEGKIIITAQLEYQKSGTTYTYVHNTEPLCYLVLKNIKPTQPISLSYDSEYGLIYWNLGSKHQILNLLSTQFNGERIVQSIDAKQFLWPGRLTFKEIEQCKFTLTVQFENLIFSTDSTPPTPLIEYNARRRTNVL